MSFKFGPKRKNPAPQRLGSSGFPDGWNSLPHASSLKDTELAELINGIYSQYGSISKRAGTQILGEAMDGTTGIINAGMFYDVGGEDYKLRINSLGKVERYNYSTGIWSLLTGTVQEGYTGDDPAFVDNSPVFATDKFVNMVQGNGVIIFANPTDRMVTFDGENWKILIELADPSTRPQLAKTGAGTGTRTYYYRYVDLNEFGNSAGSPVNDGGQSNLDGFIEDMPEIDGATYVTVTLPASPTGTTRRALYRGDTAGNEFFLADMEPSQTEYIDKNVKKSEFNDSPTSPIFVVPDENTTFGYHFYLLDIYADSLVGTTVEEGPDTLVWSAGYGINMIGTTEINTFTSFVLANGAGFDGYNKGDGQTINALQSFSVANKDGLAVFKDARVGLLEFDSAGGANIQNVNVIRGTMSPMSPHVAGNNIRFYSSEGVASLGHEENYGTILRYSVMSLKASSLTGQVTPANPPKSLRPLLLREET